MFFEEHAKLLADFARVSQAAGARADYVQEATPPSSCPAG